LARPLPEPGNPLAEPDGSTESDTPAPNAIKRPPLRQPLKPPAPPAYRPPPLKSLPAAEPVLDPELATPRGRAALANDRIKGLARRTFNKHVLSEIGLTAGLFALDAERFPDPVLVASTDGVGVKLQLAVQLGLHGAIGGDLVNHCVNDVAVQGALPLFFLDFLATGQLDAALVQQIIAGLVDACKANGCALLGGETSETPSLYGPGQFELAGFLTGVVSRPRLITGDRIQEGDCLLALPANGLHASGFDLAQQLLFQTAGYSPQQYVNQLGEKVGGALMRPHRSYLAPIRKLIQAEVVSGLAHISGGGLAGDLPRILPRGLGAQIDLNAWEPPPLYAHLQKIGELSHDDMFAHFNMGLGLVAVVPAPLLKKARLTLTRMNERSVVLGRVVKSAKRLLYN